MPTREMSPPRTADRALGRVLAVAGAIAAAGLVASGIWLMVGYRPTVAAGDPFADRPVQGADWARFAHRLSGVVLLVVAVAAVLLLGWRLAGGRSRIIGLVLAAGGLVLLLLAWASGRLLPWDQVALWAVTVGTSLDGYRVLQNDQLRFFLIQGREVSVESLRRVLLVHVVLIPIALAVMAAVAVASRRRTVVSADAPGPPA